MKGVNAPPSAAAAGVPGLTPPTRDRGPKRRIGDVIVQMGFAHRDEVEAAAESGRRNGEPLGKVLLDTDLISPDHLARVLAERNGLPHVDLNLFQWDPAAASLIDAGQARRHCALPIAFFSERALLVATADPANVVAFDDIAMATGYEVQRAVATPQEIDAVIAHVSRLADVVHEVEESSEEPANVIELHETSADAPVVKLVNSVIADAVERGASDVHFEPREGELRVRFRVDGVVSDATAVPRRLVPGVTSRIKLMSELDISERRVPQDGRVGLTVDGRYVDLRVATLPVVGGEAIVVRVLDKGRLTMDLAQLGMPDELRDRFERAVGASSGAVVVTGPTGSGKTTTLYAALSLVNTPERTLVTLEDPVEYELDGVKQVQVNPKTGLTFAAGLRSIVRADPDVMMVGEVRDRETAQIAMESALTGHLVLTTLHTNDAPMTAARLVEMGIEPFLVASGVECILAQRLVRRLCDCKKPVRLSKGALAEAGFDVHRGFSAWEPDGCVRCSGTGYRGRTGLYEVLIPTRAIRSLILERASGDDIRAAARSGGMSTLREDGIKKLREGVTSAPEVLRVLGTSRD
jgi:type IV pilus assembly protein PilB